MMNRKLKILSAELCLRMTASLLVIITFTSCVNQRNKVENEKLIPEDTFISMITDIYLATGLLTVSEIRYEFGGRDSVMNYIDIIESYGYSYEEMNNTMNYYFVSKPKKLIRIYDNIIKEMSEKESHYQNEIMKESEELSKARRNYAEFFLPSSSDTARPVLTQKAYPPGNYTVTFTATVYPGDLSFEPHFESRIVDADSVGTGRWRYFDRINYVKDGYPHRITVTNRIEGSRPVHLELNFFSQSGNIGETGRHANIVVSSFSYIPDPL
ncbi:MAG TPA: DUF4296 domain-containing protein [Bacteroidales bacterium]|nr:DUF4296 domain-containing protein [Bacteroidales bacterium]HPF02148.1 DUF4296 domain-containing protein [Bacteroidales bacterium]HPJ59239.1 DUF4296 domain-containing protein [Bacteroidales bacterium]HRW83989.1 DUF4296 domain-containing protein [Bacteroidales bacterium]